MSLARSLSDLIRRRAPDRPAPAMLSTGVEFFATYQHSRARWRVVEPSLSRPGWLCRQDGTATIVHSSALEAITVVGRGVRG